VAHISHILARVQQLLRSPNQLSVLTTAAVEELELEVRGLTSKLDQHLAATAAANPLFHLVPYMMQGMEEGRSGVAPSAWVPTRHNPGDGEAPAAAQGSDMEQLEQLHFAFAELDSLRPPQEEVARHKDRAALAARLLQANAQLQQWQQLLALCDVPGAAGTAQVPSGTWQQLEALCTLLSPMDLAVRLQQHQQEQQQQQHSGPTGGRAAETTARQLPAGFVENVVAGCAQHRMQCLKLATGAEQLCRDVQQRPCPGTLAGTLAQQFSTMDVLFSRQAALEGALSSGLSGTAAALAPAAFTALDAVALVDPGNTALLLAAAGMRSEAAAGTGHAGHQISGAAGYVCSAAATGDGGSAVAVPIFAAGQWLPAWQKGVMQLVEVSASDEQGSASPLSHAVAAAAALAVACGAAASGCAGSSQQLLGLAAMEPVAADEEVLHISEDIHKAQELQRRRQRELDDVQG
jgi:hypothetical protein